MLNDLRPFVMERFAEHPELRSIMLAVAQYYADNAQDEVHTYLVGSERDVPVWPHGCARWGDDFALAGESCEKCDRPVLGWVSRHYLERITAFAPYCLEGSDQEALFWENYLPYCIFRRDGSFEVVGTLLRGFVEASDLPPIYQPTTLAPLPPDLAARRAELFAIVCEHLDEDGPRQVLADFLVECGDPRGEYIALSLAGSLDADAAARRDRLLDEFRTTWMSPLDRVVPEVCARFERGLLAHVEVYADTPESCDLVRNAPAWRSVETLRYLPGSRPLLDHSMTALREVGPVASTDLDTIVNAKTPWAIESLHVAIYDFRDREARALLAATNLPRLRSLTVSATDFDWLGELRGVTWFGQLERLTILDAYEITSPWLVRAAEFAPVRWFCVSEKQDDRPVGWQLAYCAAEQRFEVRLAGYWPWATRPRLAALLPQLPDGPVELVGNRLWQPTDDDVRALSQTGRTVTRR